MGFLKYNKYFAEVLCNTQKLLYSFTKLAISQLSTYSCLFEFFVREKVCSILNDCGINSFRSISDSLL